MNMTQELCNLDGCDKPKGHKGHCRVTWTQEDLDNHPGSDKNYLCNKPDPIEGFNCIKVKNHKGECEYFI